MKEENHKIIFLRTLPARLKGADEIWHLGDVCEPAVLTEFQLLGPPLHVVAGNCDEHGEWPLELELDREGVKFYLTHIPPHRGPAGFAAVLHGHTHVPRDEVVAGGGMLGKVTAVGETTIGLEISKGVEVQLQRSSVVQVLPKGTLKSA